MEHMGFTSGETNDSDGYHRCKKCKSKTMLISAMSTWSVDQEAFKNGEITSRDEDVPDSVEVGEEITAHWCDTCEKITAFSFCAR